jgi:hypothetical protein
MVFNIFQMLCFECVLFVCCMFECVTSEATVIYIYILKCVPEVYQAHTHTHTHVYATCNLHNLLASQ